MFSFQRTVKAINDMTNHRINQLLISVFICFCGKTLRKNKVHVAVKRMTIDHRIGVAVLIQQSTQSCQRFG